MAISKNGRQSPDGNGFPGNGKGQRKNRHLLSRRSRAANAQPAVRYAHIVGWGMKVPDNVLTNADLEAVVETTDEWIRTRTGIQERRIAGERESVVTLGFEASRAALDCADILPSAVDLIVVATSTPEDIYPSTACKIQDRIGAFKAGAFDLSAACSGFIYALNMAAQAIRTGSINIALVVGTEVNSRILDWNDRGTCILFGDGAGAVVLQGRDEPGGLLSCVLGSDGSGAELLGIPTVGYSQLPENYQLHKLHMDGREVFRFATHIINESVRETVDKAGLTLDDIALIVPHQANQRIISAAARSLGVPEERFYSNVQSYGNTSAASIPIALCEAERDGRLNPNDNIVLVGFGGGLTWGAAAIKWQVVPVRELHGIPYRLSQGRREAEYTMAFWRARIMRLFRRLEAWLRGSPSRELDRHEVRHDKHAAREKESAKLSGRSENGARAAERNKEKTIEKR